MSELWLQIKYLNLVSTQLGNFKKKSEVLYNCRCMFCGDSTKSQKKARGYIFENNQYLVYKCHNCGYSCSFDGLLEFLNPSLHKEYRMEVFSGKVQEQPVTKFQIDITKFAKKRIDKFEPFTRLKRISQLPYNHEAKVYIESRKIPYNMHYAIYYCPKFFNWVNTIIPNKFSDETLKNDSARIILPFIDQNGYVFGFQGRALGSVDPKYRYVTIMLDSEKPKIFGLDRIDFSKKVYVVEGPIDSFFLPNCLAMGGSDVSLSNLVDSSKVVMVYDNEPRNKEIVSLIKKSIDKKYNVVIWPNGIEQKDINDMILSGMEQHDLIKLIESNTAKGIRAVAKLMEWKKIE